MFPLLTGHVRADNNLGRFFTFDPVDQTQQDVVIRLIETVREGTEQHTLSNLPRAGSAPTVPHTRDHEETVKVIQVLLAY